MIYFIDISGNIALELKNFTEAGNFSEGLALVPLSQYFIGFIDKSGEIAIETPFLEGRNFSDGLAIVKTRQKGFYEHTKTKWGAIDKTGRMVFEADFDELYDFSEGIALAVKGNEIFLIDREGNIIQSLSKIGLSLFEKI